MDNIKDIVHQVIQNIADQRVVQQKKIEQVWQVCLSKEELEHAQLQGEQAGILLVVIDSSAWLYHFKTRKSAILKKIKEELSGIQDIKFQLGNLV